MNLNDAIAFKIKKILKQNELSANRLAVLSDLTQSTVQSLIDGKSKNPTLYTIASICYGVNITLAEFFGDKIFFDLDLGNKIDKTLHK